MIKKRKSYPSQSARFDEDAANKMRMMKDYLTKKGFTSSSSEIVRTFWDSFIISMSFDEAKEFFLLHLKNKKIDQETYTSLIEEYQQVEDSISKIMSKVEE